ncbi:unnamed protein product [Gemmata massiliana]|uniref:Uncharacterized protein n=1 Tax=Gemmata massiliana TaxID=1210884 RepID=A0A6P2D7H1_9BACT|nr:unnamed protein product [Gemmata massiliana]
MPETMRPRSAPRAHVTRGTENYTAQEPSDWFLRAAGAPIVGSLALYVLSRKEDAHVDQLVAPFTLIGVLG